MPTLEETYSLAQQMPPALRLRLAAMLLEDMAQLMPDGELAGLEGYSAMWTEEDIKDAAAHSARYLDSLYPEEGNYPLPTEFDRGSPLLFFASFAI